LRVNTQHRDEWAAPVGGAWRTQARTAAVAACRSIARISAGQRERLQAVTECNSMHTSELEHLDVPPSWPSRASHCTEVDGRDCSSMAAWCNGEFPATSAPALIMTAASRGRPRGMIADATGENQLKLSRSESNWEEVVVSLARTRPNLGLCIYDQLTDEQ
jgi:hypothetical protein